jgi:hypothetical protein
MRCGWPKVAWRWWTCAGRSACRRRRSTREGRNTPRGVSELRKLRMLEEENARLRRIVADLTLDKQILQEVVKKKV